MKTPLPPPDFDQLLNELNAVQRTVPAILATRSSSVIGDYLSWDKARHKTPPEGLSHREWWLGLKMARYSSKRDIAWLLDKQGRPFSFNLPDSLLRLTDEIGRSASGNISIDEQVTNPGTRDRYIVSSLIEEAITSSQLEGASTSRHVAKQMLRSGRPPRDHSERMILNNYEAMRRIVEFKDEQMTPDRVLEIHRIVSEGTLDDAGDAGRIQTDDAQRVAVWGENAQLLHRPPVVSELPDRLERLCAFANGEEDDEFYLPPVLRAVAVHFMVGYDHYFADGNGRTARALFYWTMLRHGYWLTEFLTISTILKRAPSQYGGSFLLTEQDDGDLTHFFVYHCRVVVRAIKALHEYLAQKAEEVRHLQEHVTGPLSAYNHRQVAVLEHAIKNPDSRFTAKSHAASHKVTTQTARTDLQALENAGLMRHTSAGRELIWASAPDLINRLG